MTEGAHWRHEEVLELLKVWGEETIFSETESTRTKRKPVYATISQRLAAAGVQRDAGQVKRKIKNLKSEFKNVLRHVN